MMVLRTDQYGRQQWFSNMSLHHNHQENLLKHRLQPPTSPAHFLIQWVCGGAKIFNKFPDDSGGAAALRPHWRTANIQHCYFLVVLRVYTWLWVVKKKNVN